MAGDLFFTQEHDMLRQSVREFVERELMPNADAWEEEGFFPNSVFKRLGELGYLGLHFPEEYGGGAGDYFTNIVLMEELAKVRRVADKGDGTVTEVLLVIDATTGQNGLTQARVFADVVNITGIVLSKLDGSAKGGIVVQVQRELGVPVKLIGLGEGVDDLAPFDASDFVDALLSEG